MFPVQLQIATTDTFLLLGILTGIFVPVSGIVIKYVVSIEHRLSRLETILSNRTTRFDNIEQRLEEIDRVVQREHGDPPVQTVEQPKTKNGTGQDAGEEVRH